MTKCWLHHCIRRVEKTVNPLECQSHRGNLLHCHRREEQLQSVLKLIQEKRLDVKFVSGTECTRKPAAMFSLGNEEPGNQTKSSVFKNADPSNLEDLFLKAVKIINSNHL